MNNSSKLIKAFAVALCALSVSACQHTNVAEPSLNDTVSRNSVQMVRLPFEVKSEQDGTDSLSNVTLASLSGFLSSVNVSYADVIMLDGPNASSERISAIEDFIKESGLIYAGRSALGAEPRSGSVMLYVERYVVTTPKCGNWAPETSNNTRNNVSSFLGCSNTANLGLMVANPRDLVSGQSGNNSTAAAVGAIYTPTTKKPAGPSMTLSLEGMPTGTPTSGNQ
ncbi:MAG: CpaD family pilus assembly lipoprotein [Kordiimonas sp.]